jgi:hypothetical protein
MTNEHDDDCDCPICTGEFDWTEFYSRITDIIEKHDQYIQVVLAGPTTLGFGYTIGNTERGLPELLMIGNFSHGYLAFILDFLGEEMRKQGQPFDNGELVSIGGKHPVKIVNAGTEAREEYAIQVGEYYHHDDYVIQQVLVPDGEGRFPNETGCEAPYSEVPVLAGLH